MPVLSIHFLDGAPVSDPARWNDLHFRAGSESGAPPIQTLKINREPENQFPVPVL